MKSQNNYIIIEGNIGAGKTSLASDIAQEYDAKLILEQFDDNPFLPKFYDNPDRYGFSLELSFLAARYKQLNAEIQSTDLFKSFTIADYYFVKSLIFSRSTLHDDEYNLYRQLFDIIYQQLPLPDLYVYLHVNVDRLMENIKRRGRDYEQGIMKKYLQNVQDSYFNFFKTVDRFPVLIIDTTELDFVKNKDDYYKITELIFNRKYDVGVHKLNV